MENITENFSRRLASALRAIPHGEVAKAVGVLKETYERGGRIYVFGNGGSFALADHFVADLNKTVASRHLTNGTRRFRAVRIPTSDAELTAWANDVGYDMVLAGPLENHLESGDAVVAISSSGNSENIIRAVELAKAHRVPVIGLSGFDGGKLNELADAKVCIVTEKGDYGVVESVHGAVLHLITEYFADYVDRAAREKRTQSAR